MANHLINPVFSPLLPLVSRVSQTSKVVELGHPAMSSSRNLLCRLHFLRISASLFSHSIKRESTISGYMNFKDESYYRNPGKMHIFLLANLVKKLVCDWSKMLGVLKLFK